METEEMIRLLKNLKLVSLTRKEKDELRAALIDRIKSKKAGQKWGRLSILIMRPVAVAGLILLLIGSSSITIAAEKSLPDELLYSFKININEEIRSAVLSALGRGTDWEIQRTERRLWEAEQLLSENRLKKETAAKLQIHFQTHYAAVERRIASDRDAERQAELHGSFEAKLKAHDYILSNLRLEDNEDITPLLEDVRARTANVSRNRSATETQLSSQPDNELQIAATNRSQQTEAQIARIQELLQQKTDEIGPSVRSQSEDKLQQAETLIENGRKQLNNGRYGEAFSLFSESSRLIQESETIIEGSIRLKHDFGPSVKGQSTEIGPPEHSNAKRQNQ